MKKKKMENEKVQFSKKLILDVRGLLWVVSIGGILLAFYCIYQGFTGSLGWITTLVGLPWASHATICSLYLNKSKAENTAADGTGIVYAAAQAKNFMEQYEANKEKYASAPSTYPQYEEDEEVILDEDYDNSPPI